MTETLFSMILVTELCWGREREQVFNDKQKDGLDGAAVSTAYLQQYFYTDTTTQM